MGAASLTVVGLSGANQLESEQVELSVKAFSNLQLPVPADFSRPGERRQLLVRAGVNVALFTIAGQTNAQNAEIGIADLARLSAGPVAAVEATTDLFADGDLSEELHLEGDVAVVAPHGGSIEAGTDSQVRRMRKEKRLCLDSWICAGVGANQSPRLHITSGDLSEHSFASLDRLLKRRHDFAVSFHGYQQAVAPHTNQVVEVIVGGRGLQSLKDDIAQRIRLKIGSSFHVYVANNNADPFAGLATQNIVNRLASSGGVQIETSQNLRASAAAADGVAAAVAEALLAARASVPSFVPRWLRPAWEALVLPLPLRCWPYR